TSLPPLRTLAEHSLVDIAVALRGMRQLYWPPPLPPKLSVPRRNVKRPGRHIPYIRGDDKIPDSGYASAVVSDDESDLEETIDNSDSSDALDELRADPFERAFAIKWLTGLICRADTLSSDNTAVDSEDAREALIEEATAILSLFSHHEDEEEYAVTRSFSFPSSEKPVCIELNDAPLSSSDHTSVGLQSWGSSIVLAERLCAAPAVFNLSTAADNAPLRVLELGAGTGLLSIAVAKLLPSALVVATDYHPDILANLSTNIHTNFPARPDQVRIRTLDWARPAFPAPLHEPFDVVLAADVVYHPEHARWIRGCVARMLRRPRPGSSDAGGVFHLIVPVRPSGRHEGMHRTVDEVFRLADVGKQGLAVLHTEVVERQGAGVGRADEAGYRMFKIAW
ncbi:S-adenosyl-L-methionine-dependent methyltransferase, partial [Mycena sp. CBHHK59/15]